MFEKLKNKWGINSNFQIIMILIVFSVNGSLAVKLAKPVTAFIGIPIETTSPWIYYPIKIIVMFIIYQVLLVFVGALFGQFEFFWKMEKKMLKRMGLKKFFPEESLEK